MGVLLFLLLLLSVAPVMGKVMYSNGLRNGSTSSPLTCQEDNNIPEE